MSCGIYLYTNKLNNKKYVGQSVNIEQRFISHLKSYSTPFDIELHNVGLDNFSFEIIELCKKEELNQKEKYWIEFYDTYNNGYNQTTGNGQSEKLLTLDDLNNNPLTFKYKKNICDELKKKGYNGYQCRLTRVFGQSTLTQFRNNEMVSLENLRRACILLNCQIGDIIELG